MRLNIDFYTFLERMLPVHKRQTNRLSLFWWSLLPKSRLKTSFNEWRNDILFRTNITGQFLSLQTYLNKYVDGANSGIIITEAEDYGVWCCLEDEDSDSMYMGLESEEDEAEDYIEISIKGEAGTVLDVSFRIIAPSTANVDQINKHVKQFKIAGKSFDVVTS